MFLIIFLPFVLIFCFLIILWQQSVIREIRQEIPHKLHPLNVLPRQVELEITPESIVIMVDGVRARTWTPENGLYATKYKGLLDKEWSFIASHCIALWYKEVYVPSQEYADTISMSTPSDTVGRRLRRSLSRQVRLF